MCSTASSQPLSSYSPCTAYVPVRGTAAPTVTVEPCEPAGQVPIGGLSSAQAKPTNPNGSGPPRDRAPAPAPVATACRRSVRRERGLWKGDLVLATFSSQVIACSKANVLAFSRARLRLPY